MIDDGIVLRAERLRDDIASLLTQLKRHYGSANSIVALSSIKETASSIAERWLVELAPREDLKRIIKEAVLVEIGLECQRILTYADGSAKRGKYDKALKAILSGYRNEVIIPMKQARNHPTTGIDVAPMLPARVNPEQIAFLGQSFAPSDVILNEKIKAIVEAYGVPCLTGEKPRAERVSVKVRQRIDLCTVFMGIFTRREKIKGKSEWTTSPWIIDEKAYAFAKGKKLILLKETGVGSIGGIQGDYEYVDFQRDGLPDLFIKLIQILVDVSKGSKSAE
jgi:hypothetical protein